MLKVYLMMFAMAVASPQAEYTSVDYYEDQTELWFMNPATSEFNAVVYNYETGVCEWY